MLKWTKRIVVLGVVGTVALVGIGWAVGGNEAFSYLKSSSRILQTSVKDSIPIDFEIQRARHLLEDLVPELRANLRLVAKEEVEVANLEKELEGEKKAITNERGKVEFLRDTLSHEQVSYRLGSSRLEYTRDEVVEELSRRFEHLRTAEMLFKGKQDLLRNRQRSLDAAMKKLERNRLARVELESQIESVEAQFRLLEAQSTDSEFHIDESKITQTYEIIRELKKRLEVASRVLAREATFVEMIPIERVQESSVIDKVDRYLDGGDETRPAEENTSVIITQ